MIRLDRYIFVIGIVLLAVLALTNLLVISLIMSIAFVLSFFINKFGLRAIGIELVTFVAVVTGYTYGAFAGVVVALVLIVFHLLVSGYFGIYFAWVIPEYPVAAYIASTMAGQGIVFVGILITIGLNIFNFTITALVARENIGKYLPFMLTNIAFNAALFLLGGQFIAGVLK